MKILTVLGTRPEIIRLSAVIEKIDSRCDHVLVHTGQNFDPALSDTFFRELGVRAPDYALGIRADSFGEQAGKILAECERVMKTERPDRLLILGDTNSGLCALPAKRLGISVYHLEAGNRCYDHRVPEEINRRVIDHVSDIWMPYTERSRANLLREGIPGDSVFVVGNPIREVILRHEHAIANSQALRSLGLDAGRYFLVTIHRAENVDRNDRLHQLAVALNRIQEEYGLPVIVSTHPRTRSRMDTAPVTTPNPQVRWLAPFGFADFVSLERGAACVLTDSGTVQEEACIFGIPNVTLRDVTERPETIECGSNILSGVDPDSVLMCVRTALAAGRTWTPPSEYLRTDVSDAVVKILVGHRPGD